MLPFALAIILIGFLSIAFRLEKIAYSLGKSYPRDHPRTDIWDYSPIIADLPLQLVTVAVEEDSVVVIH